VGKLEWASNGNNSNEIKLVQSAALKPGDKVVVTNPSPSMGWGGVHPWSVGSVASFSASANRCTVAFPENQKWKGVGSDVALASSIAHLPGAPEGQVDFVDFDSIHRIVGVSPCHPHARTGVTVLIQTYEQDPLFDKAAFVKLSGGGAVVFTGRESSLATPHKVLATSILRGGYGLVPLRVV